MYEGIPIIGVAGGVGSGKSHVARLFGELGCLVIDSDAQAAAAYARPEVLQALRQWWGEEAFSVDGRVDRRAIARRVFASADERRRLEQLIHPVVAALRDEQMAGARLPPDRRPAAIVWDTPLLFEAGLAAACDAVVFVDAPRAARLDRVRASRGWDEAELARRENSQWPLDKKRTLSHHVVTNAGPPATPARDSEPPVQAADVTPDSAGGLRPQVRLILSRILAAMNGTHRDAGLESG